ncbi:MAG: UDP-N-acetylmuramoyl-L-alanine--D-glutamate ligase, partial [Pseudomonadota bacterium]|nr:UDP-N-acetylmuramoyl-L-alanine--D-glutamate ligase [Pseudomonadota bacterium]
EDIPEALFKPPDDWPWDELEAVVISPGIPHEFPAPHQAVNLADMHDVPVISEIEFALRTTRQGRWIAITGTNGKSTTTALTGHILRQAGLNAVIGGNIGDPVTGLPVQDEDGIAVIELSSYQLETTPSLRADVRVILNITPDHLDRHGGWDGYVAAKQAVLATATADQLVILGQGEALDETAEAWHQHARILRLDNACLNEEKQHNAQADNPVLQGEHNCQNCAAARLICREMGVSDQQINEGIASFGGLPHRLQPAGRYKHIRFINDSKATNAEAAAKALASFTHIHWCAGGLAKEDGLSACLPYLTNVQHGYFYGRCAVEFAQAVTGKLPNSVHQTLEEAVEAATLSAGQSPQEDQVILLSPAAASFDQFTSFEARGEAFCQIAEQQIAHLKATQTAEERTVGHV